MKISSYFYGVCALATALFAVGCAVTHTDYELEPCIATPVDDASPLRFTYVLYANDQFAPIAWTTPETYGPAPAARESAPGTHPYPILYKTNVDIVPEGLRSDFTTDTSKSNVVFVSTRDSKPDYRLSFDSIEAQGVAVMVNNRIVLKEFRDTEKPLYDLNPYIEIGSNEIVILCVPKGEIDPNMPPMLLNGAKLSACPSGCGAQDLTAWEYASDLAGIAANWQDPCNSAKNCWQPWYAITQLFEFHNPAPASVEPQWVTVDLDKTRPIDFNMHRDTFLNFSNWSTLGNWYKLDFKLPEGSAKNWRLTVQSFGGGYLWLNGKRITPDAVGKQIISFTMPASELKKDAENSIVICLTPTAGIPSLLAAEIRPE